MNKLGNDITIFVQRFYSIQLRTKSALKKWLCWQKYDKVLDFIFGHFDSWFAFESGMNKIKLYILCHV